RRRRGDGRAAIAIAIAIAARALDSHAAPPPELVAPRAIETPAVPYPPNATGTASVIVEVTVDATGKVAKAVVTDGPEPFASAALASAPTWRFEPAHRGDVRVSARIRVLVDFHPTVVAKPDE